MNVSGIILSAAEEFDVSEAWHFTFIFCQASPIGFSEVWHTFDSDGWKEWRGRAFGSESCFQHLQSVVLPRQQGQSAGRAPRWTGPEVRGRADRTACLPLNHLHGTHVNESISYEAATASLLSTSSMAVPKSQLWTWACAECNEMRGHIFPEPHCQHVASAQLKLAGVATQTSLQPKAQ